MTNGYGSMYSYASRVAVDDRWRIASYIRACSQAKMHPAGVAARYTESTGGVAAGGSK